MPSGWIRPTARCRSRRRLPAGSPGRCRPGYGAGRRPSRTSRLPRRDVEMKRFLALLAVLGGMVVVPTATAHADSTVTLTGVVRDGGAHGWPLWASVSVGSVSAKTSPVSGQYSLDVPAASTYDLHVRSPGYQDVSEQVTGSADVKR